MYTNYSLATTEDLVVALSASLSEGFCFKGSFSYDNSYVFKQALLQKAYHAGWIEQQDLLDPSAPIERRHLARILHMFLCLIKKEADELDTSSAYKLKDLYDCRSCTGHVMQIYAKGIMDGQYLTPSLYLFGMKEHVTGAELDTILKRVYHPEYRLKNLSG